ncbi:MAG: hypothetical protein K2F63_05360, partial [Muribaculaceae bacterium]|nr:hypothetical protein [Muribaculaceae bacterium]
PLSTQYFGLGSEFSVMNLNTGIAVYPVNAPLTFMNNTWEDYNYTWHYCDPETGDWATSNDPYELTVQYAPDYSSDFTKRNNLFYPPYLTATAEGYSEGRADMPAVTYIQAGGAPEWVEKIGEDEFSFEFGLLPFNVIDTKISYYTEPAPEYGERSTPIFGHDKNTTKYWTDYTFRGDAGENDKAEVVSVLNFIYTSEGMNLVFDKAWIHAVGMVAADAEFTLSVHDMVPVYDEDGDYIGEAPNEDPIASATLLGKDVAGNFETDMINSLSFVFSFDEPVVLDDSSNAYIVKFSGFNSDKVTWLAPVQQWKPNGWALGWIEKAITYDGVTRNSYNP